MLGYPVDVMVNEVNKRPNFEQHYTSDLLHPTNDSMFFPT
jgi:hypothetical protein